MRRLPKLTDFDPVIHVIDATKSSDRRLGELLVMVGWNFANQGENAIIKTARDTSDGPVRAVLQPDLRCLADIVNRFLLAPIRVNRHLSLLCQCSLRNRRSQPVSDSCAGSESIEPQPFLRFESRRRLYVTSPNRQSNNRIFFRW